jgi:hypothetical protein
VRRANTHCVVDTRVLSFGKIEMMLRAFAMFKRVNLYR